MFRLSGGAWAEPTPGWRCQNLYVLFEFAHLVSRAYLLARFCYDSVWLGSVISEEENHVFSTLSPSFLGHLVSAEVMRCAKCDKSITCRVGWGNFLKKFKFQIKK